MAIFPSATAHNGNNGKAAAGEPSSTLNQKGMASASSSSQLSSLVMLADDIASNPERFALIHGDLSISQDSLQALRDVFADALASEGESLPYIGNFLRETLDAPIHDTRSAKSKKRKRPAQRLTPYHSLFPPTPLSGLVTDGLSEAQIWEQLEFRGKAIDAVLSQILVSSGGDVEDAPEDEVELEMDKRSDEEQASDDEDEMIRHISSLSDADLRAVGIDPALRSQLIAGDGEFQPDEDEEDSDIEDEYADGYPGASDISSDEEEAPGSSKRVFFEPLKTEREQRKRKEAEEMQGSFQWASQGMDVDQEEDSYESDEDDDSSQQEQESTIEEAEVVAQPSRKRPKSILDSLDEAVVPAKSSHRKASGHPILDDDFFSIDEFNRQSEEEERREIFKAAGDDQGSDDEDVDLFQMFEGQSNGMNLDEDGGLQEDSDGNDPTEIRFADFFLPPASTPKAGGRGTADRRSKGKGKGSRVGEGAKLAKRERDRLLANASEDVNEEAGAGAADLQDSSADQSSESEAEIPARRNTKVRFAPTVAIRNIKSRRKRCDVMNEIQRLQAMSDREDADGEDKTEESSTDDENDDDDDEGTSDEETGETDEPDDSEAMTESEAGASDFDEDHQDEIARRFAEDLFEDEAGEEDELQGGGLSAHEKRLANLQKEIARLESENVGAKEWTLSGEASSRARPKDSLLEEDLDFEQSAKPTPTITVESTESLEALIKRRILEGLFDDVVPRRAIAQAEYKAEYELSDRKSSRSLAEEYENDFQLANGGGDEASEFKGESQLRLEKDRAEVNGLMDDIFNRLDALSNAHFIPKAPKMKITTLSSAPALNVQEGLPTSSMETSQLAPQEVFDLSNSGDSSVLQGDKSEMTPQEKQALFKRKKQELKRRQEDRERSKAEKRMNDLASGKVQPGSSGETRREKQDALKSLIGNKGVSVVGKGKQDKKGKKGQGQTLPKSADADKKGEKYKL